MICFVHCCYGRNPSSLIINWDQTGTHFVPVSQWTMDVKGARRVYKRQMTMV